MKKIIYWLFVISAVLGSSSTTYAAVGDLINIQFGTGLENTYGAVANSSHPQYWNNFYRNNSGGSLYYSTGISYSSGASISYSVTENHGINASATSFTGNDQGLFTGWLSTDVSNTGIFNFTGLSQGTYSLYVYSQVDKTITSRLSLSGNASGSITNTGDLTGLTNSGDNKNYMVQTVSVGSNGLLDIGIGNNNQINGFQLKQLTSGAPVPEPASILLISLGGFFIAFRLRKFNGTLVSVA